MNINFSVNVNYWGDPPAPQLEVELKHCKADGDSHFQPMIVDTGAERTVVAGTIAKEIGLDLTAGKVVPILGAIGFNQKGYLHTVRLAIADLGEFEEEILFTEWISNGAVLGRTFLRHFVVAFDESLGIMYFSAKTKV